MTTEPAVRDHYVVLDGLRVHDPEWGATDAPPLVILHGLSVAAHTYDRLAAALADRLRVLVPDLWGHGETDWAADYAIATFVHDLELLATELHLDRFALLGLSLGGTIGYPYAARYPDRVERLVIGDIGPDVFTLPALAATLALQRAQGDEVFDDPEEPIQRALAAPNPAGSPDPGRIREQLAYNLVQGTDGRRRFRYDAGGLGRMIPLGSEAEAVAWAALEQVRCPTLVVRGERSSVLSRETAERMVQTLVDGHWVDVPAASHQMVSDNFTGVLTAIRPFLLEPHASRHT